MKNVVSILISIGLLLVIFLIGFFLFNIVMKIAVGHGSEVNVPDLVGSDFNVAVKICKSSKLYLEQIEVVNNDDIDKGKIISQIPHPGINTKKFRTVEVVVSNGPELVRIPFLYNLSAKEAKLKLENAGLKLGEKIYRYSDEVGKNKVVYSQPIADELIAKRSPVDVIVSLGSYTSSSSENKWKDLLDNE